MGVEQQGQEIHVPSHFSSIGFPVRDRDEFGSLAIKALSGGKTVETDQGTYVLWRDAFSTLSARQSGKDPGQ